MKKVFYSWQSDIKTSINRNLIENAIEKAIKRVNKDIENDDDKFELDKDTINTPGSPDIVETIVSKINACSIFIGDITPVAESDSGKKMPNSNVFFESGYAVGNLGFNRVLLIHNDAFARVEDLPFDVKTKRILTYTLSQQDALNTEVKANIVKSVTARIYKTLELESELPVSILDKKYDDVNAEIKRSRDLTKLKRFMENLPAKALQNHIALGKESMMMDFNTLTALYNMQAVQQFASFKFYDKTLKNYIDDLVSTFDQSLSFTSNFFHQSNTKYIFRSSKRVSEEDYIVVLNKLDVLLKDFLDYVHEQYVEIDVEEDIKKAWAKYVEEINEEL
ncbi:hypothetical protein GNY17_00530 [Vibrio parahaemolyticus]|nr:TIR domain-containing protein [Vibrio parahaemolyticus]EKH9213224.1 hypothetical protein [Vibrio parahaemolyticus]MCR9889509.1 nucleotide-binding protein [Vibrio parahaemolyticus]MCX8814202.1 nucleotide-binding protein [Vibrio parahaemolyticus]MCX8819546.1 nucleotide-binding protein [Vibrio parahaemolyticus]MCX8840027.1 nucleotide-binding protein [Vibrio parahaemolyticus]